jgi:hypothetical protein
MEVVEMMNSMAEFHIVKFEVDKLHTLGFSSHYDGNAV